MTIIGVDGGSVYLRIGILEWQRLVRYLADMDNDDSEKE